MVFLWWVTWFDTLFVKKKLDYKRKNMLRHEQGKTGNLTLYEEIKLGFRRILNGQPHFLWEQEQL